MLYTLPLVEDPSDEITGQISGILVKSLEWNMLSTVRREWNLTVSDLSELRQLIKGFLNALNEHLPDTVGKAKGRKFEQAHSIFNKVCEDGRLTFSCEISGISESFQNFR